MSGHSKWHSIKHKKGKEDAKRGKIFSKLSRAVSVAAKEGGGDPDLNPSLGQAIEKAKEYNMPADNIKRAVQKDTGEIAGATYEHMIYEAYGPGGIAMMIDIMTDNKNRTAADMRHIFTKHGGKLGTSGSVAWMFEQKALALVQKGPNVDEDNLMTIVLEAGAEDMAIEEKHYEIKGAPKDLNNIKAALEDSTIAYSSAEITYLPKDTVKPDAADAKKLLKLMEILEEHDDVQNVYANFDIDDEVIEDIAG